MQCDKVLFKALTPHELFCLATMFLPNIRNTKLSCPAIFWSSATSLKKALWFPWLILISRLNYYCALMYILSSLWNFTLKKEKKKKKKQENFTTEPYPQAFIKKFETGSCPVWSRLPWTWVLPASPSPKYLGLQALYLSLNILSHTIGH